MSPLTTKTLRRGVAAVLGVVAVILLALALLGVFERREESRSASPSDDDPRVRDESRLSGISHHVYRGADRLYSVEADEVTRRKARVGPLTLNPLEEIDMTGVRISVNFDPSTLRDGATGFFQTASLQEMLEETFNAKDLGWVSGVRIHGLEIIREHGGEQQLRLQANEASAALSRPSILFPERFMLTSRTGERVVARQVEWNTGTREFRIEGTYLYIGPGGRQTGRTAVVTVGPGGELRLREPQPPS